MGAMSFEENVMQEQPNPFNTPSDTPTPPTSTPQEPVPSYNAPIPSPTGGMPAVFTNSGVNDSGTGATAVLPAELRGFNWGGFLLSLFWAIAHNTWLGLLCLVPGIGWIMSFVLGFKGNEWAWQNRKWDSIEHFRATQKVWTIWGIIIAVLMLVLWIGFSILGAMFSGLNR
jgi:hypothetical protein